VNSRIWRSSQVPGPATFRNSLQPSMAASSEAKLINAKPPARTLRKVHGLQGPIDDAFLERFLIVRPTGQPMHEATGKWAKGEMERAIREWRRQFRGDALVTVQDRLLHHAIRRPRKLPSSSSARSGRVHDATGLKPLLAALRPASIRKPS